MNVHRVSSLVLLVALTAQAHSQTIVMGFGAATCGQFATDYRRAPKAIEQAYFNWAQGFLSGNNFGMLTVSKDHALAVDLKSYSLEEQRAFIRQYCDAHPLASYMDAVVDLYQKLIVAQTTKKPQ